METATSKVLKNQEIIMRIEFAKELIKKWDRDCLEEYVASLVVKLNEKDVYVGLEPIQKEIDLRTYENPFAEPFKGFYDISPTYDGLTVDFTSHDKKVLINHFEDSVKISKELNN